MADAGGGDADEHLVGLAAGRARPPRSRRGRLGSRRTAARIRISRSGTARARRSRGRRRGPGPSGGPIVPSAAISSVDGEQPVAALGRPRRRVERHLEVRAGRERERGVEVREQPVAVRPRVRAPRASVAPRRSPRCGARPSIPPERTTSGWTTSTPPRTTRSRASAAERTISPAAIRMPRRALRAPRSRRRRRSAAAPRASRRRVARARGRTPRAVARSQRGVRSPGMRQPWFASTMMSSSGDRLAHRLDHGEVDAPVARVEAELDGAHARVAQRATPANALVGVDELAARRVGEDAIARRRRAGARAARPRARPRRSQTATSTIQLRPWWKSTVSRIPWTVVGVRDRRRRRAGARAARDPGRASPLA